MVSERTLRDVTILVAGTEPWFGPLLSKHHLTLELSKFNNVVYLDPVFHMGNLMRLSWPKRRLRFRYHNHKPNTLTLLKPWWLPKTATSKTMRCLSREFMEWQIKALRVQPELIISFDPGLAWLKSKFKVPLIYYCVDTQYDRAQEQMMLEQADIVLVATRKLYADFVNRTPHLEYLAHGIDLESYTHAAASIPEEMKRIPHPICGFVGSVNAHLDVQLIEEVATALPHLSIVFVGPYEFGDFGGGLNPTKLSRLRKHNNIYLLGPKPSARLGAYINQFDIGMIPYDLQHLRVHFSYHKILQYLALGKPIASTVKPVDEPLPGVVRCADEKNSFIHAIESLLHEYPRLNSKEAFQFAKMHSWTRRIEQLSQWLEVYELLTDPVRDLKHV